MQTSTADQLETAIEILSKLRDRLDTEAAHSIVHMPKTQLGIHYSGDIWLQTIEQASRIAALSNQLKNWRDELPGPGNPVSVGASKWVRRLHLKTSAGNLWLWSKNLLAAKWRHRQMS